MLDNDEVETTPLPYQELEENVWQKNICAGCRACIAVCLADTLAFDTKLNKPIQVAPCIDCKACLDACPRMPLNSKNADSSGIIGPYIEAWDGVRTEAIERIGKIKLKRNRF